MSLLEMYLMGLIKGASQCLKSTQAVTQRPAAADLLAQHACCAVTGRLQQRQYRPNLICSLQRDPLLQVTDCRYAVSLYRETFYRQRL